MRTVIEEHAVSNVIDAERAIYPRLAEAFDGLKWWLSHRPESGVLLDEESWIYKQAGNEKLNIPSLVTIYTFDHICVTLKFILVRLPSL
jgi:hypothetical protein